MHERYCIIRVHHIKTPVPGKCVLNNLFLVKVTFNQADALKLTKHFNEVENSPEMPNISIEVKTLSIIRTPHLMEFLSTHSAKS